MAEHEQETISWFAGVDWGSERHQVCLLDARGTTVGEREFPHSGEGLAELGDWLLSMASAASTVAVAIEVPHGPVVDALIDRGFVVYAINPKQLDRLRDRFSVAGAKDDRRDAYVQADSLRTDRRLFRRLQVADPRLIELRAWSRLAEELRAERVRLGNRVRHQLWRYYPQMLKLTNDLAAPWFLELWAIASTPAKAGRLRKSTVERLLKQHRIRRLDAETVLRILREPAIKVAEGVAEAASIHMRSLVARLCVVNRELREAERKLDELCLRSPTDNRPPKEKTPAGEPGFWGSTIEQGEMRSTVSSWKHRVGPLRPPHDVDVQKLPHRLFHRRTRQQPGLRFEKHGGGLLRSGSKVRRTSLRRSQIYGCTIGHKRDSIVRTRFPPTCSGLR